MPTVNVTASTKAELDSIRAYPRETYDQLLSRIVKEYKEIRFVLKVR